MKPSMFIGSSSEHKHVADAIHQNLWKKAEITPWDQGVFQPTASTLESLVDAVKEFDFAVFILSPDDLSEIRKQQVSVVRDNVVFEAGLFMGKLGRERVFLLVPDNEKQLHLPTDLLGITTLPYEAVRRVENWQAATGPACTAIGKIVDRLGCIPASQGIVAYGYTVKLMTFDGCYVQIDSAKHGTLLATSRKFGEWDKFEVVSVVGVIRGSPVKFGDKIGLKAVKNKQYVGADFNNSQEKSVGAWVPEMKLWETFEVHAANSKYKAGDVVPYGASLALWV